MFPALEGRFLTPGRPGKLDMLVPNASLDPQEEGRAVWVCLEADRFVSSMSHPWYVHFFPALGNEG